jgi:glucose-6-phosphate 1-dehydrogenase
MPMETETRHQPTVLVIFGGAGDLARRKLVPALYNVSLDKGLPESFAVIGVDRKSTSDEEFRAHLREGVGQFSRRGKVDDAAWDAFARQVSFVGLGSDDSAALAGLSRRLAELDKAWDAKATRIFYLATPPAAVEAIATQLGKAGLAETRDRARIVVEKPFGWDLESARSLNAALSRIFDESQIYRIDHYLGKETVQNILAFRFANALFEPIWDRRYIDHVQITVAEAVGVEHRGDYYDRAGALRDMVQSHLMQVLCLVAMEPMVSFDADEIRNKKVDLLRAIRPISPDEVSDIAVRGQYGEGRIRGERVPGYRGEPDVPPDSATETFAALKLFVDNWRWQDVPFYLRTGKRMPVKSSMIVIQFRPPPHRSFPRSAAMDWQPDRLFINIQPDEGIVLRVQAKQPAPHLRLSPVNMQFRYQDAFKAQPPDAYETLLLDVMRGDATLFRRADQIETGWSVITPVLNAWTSTPAADFPNYAAGTWGPESAEALTARDGRRWMPPTWNDTGPK